MSIMIQVAKKEGVIPLIGFVGESGGGKTKTALLVARGYAGPNGKIVGIDTENKRMLHFAEEIPGGFDHIDLQPPFSPEAYLEAIQLCESKGYKAIVVDSMSHEWNGSGGYLELKEQEVDKMSGGDYKKRERCAIAAAARVKPRTHTPLVEHIKRSGVMIIMCFRGKQKVRMGKDEEGKFKVDKDAHISPIQDSEIIFECLIAGEVYWKDANIDGTDTRIGGYFQCQKHTVNSLLAVLPKQGEQFGIKHGELLAKWCNSGGKVSQPALPTSDQKPLATTEQRERMVTQLCAKFGLEVVMEYAIAKGIIQPNQTLSDWPLVSVAATKADYTLRESNIQTWKAAQ